MITNFKKFEEKHYGSFGGYNLYYSPEEASKLVLFKLDYELDERTKEDPIRIDYLVQLYYKGEGDYYQMPKENFEKFMDSLGPEDKKKVYVVPFEEWYDEEKYITSRQ